MTSPSSHTPFSPHAFARDACLRLLGLIAGLYLTGVTALFFGIHLNLATALAGIAVGLTGPHLLSTSRSTANGVGVVVIALASLAFSSAFFDGTSDGLGYHKPAVLQFLAGWNPYADGAFHDTLSYWSVVYPKASWICAAQLTFLTGQLESAKAINLLAMAAAGFAAWDFFLSRLPSRPRLALLIAVLVSLNPVALAQCVTFYVDGIVASLLTILLFRFADRISGKGEPRAVWFEIAACTVLLANLKFTGLVYAGIIWLIAGVFLWRMRGVRVARHATLIGLAVFALAVGVCGKTPYTDNLSAGRHLFHPLMGAQKNDFMPNFRPAQFAAYDRFTRFALANFSQEAGPHELTEPRWPFQFKPFAPFWADARVGGLGPFYGEALVITLLALILLRPWQRRLIGPTGAFLLITVLATAFCHEDAWWARYSPQLFLLVPLALIALIRARVFRSIFTAHALVILLTANALLVAFNSVGRSAWVSYRFNQDLAAMSAAATPQHPIEVNFSALHPLARQLQEKRIAFVEVPATNTDGWFSIYSTITCFWRPAPQP